MQEKNVKCPKCGRRMHINHHFNSFPNYVCETYGWDPEGKCSLVISVREYEDKYVNRTLKVQQETMEKCHEYYEEFAKENGNKGFIWLKNDETGQLMVYTRGEYTKEIMQFLNTLK